MRLKTAIKRFNTQLLADGKSDHTRSAYKRDLRLFQQWLGHSDINKIKPLTIASFFTSDLVKLTANNRPKAIITINRIKTSVKAFFSFMCIAGYLKKDPARLIKAGKVSRKLPVTLTQSDAQHLLTTIKKSKHKLAGRDFVMISLLLKTGIRLSSLVNLNAGDINFKHGIIAIKTKGNGEQIVFINSDLKRLLRGFIKSKKLKADSPLFQTTNCNRLGIRQIQQRVAFWLKEAGISNSSVHTFRHTFATQLYEKTHDLYLVQKALGHKQITATEIYTRVSNKSLRQAVNLL